MEFRKVKSTTWLLKIIVFLSLLIVVIIIMTIEWIHFYTVKAQKCFSSRTTRLSDQIPTEVLSRKRNESTSLARELCVPNVPNCMIGTGGHVHPFTTWPSLGLAFLPLSARPCQLGIAHHIMAFTNVSVEIETKTQRTFFPSFLQHL